MIEFAQHSVEIAWLAVFINIERTDVHLIDNQLVVGGRGEGITVPVEAGVIVNNAIAHRIGDLTGIGVNAFQFHFTVFKQKFVFLPWLCPVYIDIPVTVLFASERVFALGPVVKIAHDKDLLCMRRPYSEGCAAFMGDGSHAGPVFSFLFCCCSHISCSLKIPAMAVLKRAKEYSLLLHTEELNRF